MNLMSKIFRKNDKENITLIRNSDLFDEEYYLKENKNVHINAAKHYYYYGYKEGKSPSYDFSNDYYLETYKDIKDADINPLVHYLKYGKKENRLIKKDSGMSIKDLYYELYNYNYSINLYKIDNDMKRINLFFCEINENITDYLCLFKYIFNFCNMYKYALRIIYTSADLNELNNLLKKNKINIPKEVEYLYLKNNNYLFVGKNEKFICTSYKCVNALINSNGFASIIYFYLNSVGSNIEEKYYISKACINRNVISLVNDKNILKKLRKISLKFNINQNVKIDGDVYYNSNSLFIKGIEILNKLYLENILDYKKNNLFVANNDIKFHLDSDTRIYNYDVIVNDSVLFSLNTEEETIIEAFLEEENIFIENYIDIKKNQFDLFNKDIKYIEVIDEDYLKLKKSIVKNSRGEDNV